VVEAAFAGALGVRLGGTNVYDGVIEDRGTLGGTRPVAVADIRRAARLSLLVSTAAAGVAVAFALRSRTSIVTRAPFRGVSPRWADRGTEFQRRRR
jgi:adenosylcobinamide-phosphate synthase